jgi:hypothetical protein
MKPKCVWASSISFEKKWMGLLANDEKRNKAIQFLLHAFRTLGGFIVFPCNFTILSFLSPKFLFLCCELTRLYGERGKYKEMRQEDLEKKGFLV